MSLIPDDKTMITFKSSKEFYIRQTNHQSLSSRKSVMFYVKCSNSFPEKEVNGYIVKYTQEKTKSICREIVLHLSNSTVIAPHIFHLIRSLEYILNGITIKNTEEISPEFSELFLSRINDSLNKE